MAKLPILMYHNVTNQVDEAKGLVISEASLEQQFQYLSEQQYTSFHFSELENRTIIPKKSIVITFDDVTENQLIWAVPLLEKYHLKATFFVPFAYIGKTDLWNDGTEKIMSIDQLKQLPTNIELGLHSHIHGKYADYSETELQTDFRQCFEIIAKHELNVCNALAYPYGNYPKKEPNKSMFKTTLQKNKVTMGLRIGNKINRFPFPNPYEITRIDIKGENSLLKFRLKLIFGKLRLF